MLKVNLYLLILSFWVCFSVVATEIENNPRDSFTYESPLTYSIETNRNPISSITIDLHYDNSESLCGEVPDDVEEISIEQAEKMKCSDDVVMIFQGDHIMSEAITCPETSKFVCLNGLGIIFSIPREVKNVIVWEHQETKFSRSEELINVSLLGLSVDVYFIVAKGGSPDFAGQEQHFWYSPRRGLIGFKIVYLVEEGTVERMRILTGQCGFGSDKKCS